MTPDDFFHAVEERQYARFHPSTARALFGFGVDAMPEASGIRLMRGVCRVCGSSARTERSYLCSEHKRAEHNASSRMSQAWARAQA